MVVVVVMMMTTAVKVEGGGGDNDCDNVVECNNDNEDGDRDEIISLWPHS